MDPTAEFQQLMHDEWEFRLQAEPLFATSTGDRRYNDRLPRMTVDEYARQEQALAGFRARLDGIPRADLAPADRLNYDLFQRYVDENVRELAFRGYFFPIARVGGIHTYFPELYAQVPLETTADLENYIARLEAFSTLADDLTGLLREGLRQGYLPPRVTLEGVLDAIEKHIVADPAQSSLHQPFTAFPSGVPESDRARLASRGAEAIRTAVVPGFARLRDFVRDEYLPEARESVAAADLPDGSAFYQHRIRSYTGLQLSPAEIHETGMGEVERIQAEMAAIVQAEGFGADFAGFQRFLREDPRFYAKTADELLQRTALLLKRVDGELPRLFGTLPRTPYGIRVIPEFAAPGSTTAYYFPPAGDGTRGGYYYVNTYDLPSRPLYEIEALSLHEAVPGHHLQIALQMELDLPPFRRFFGLTAFVEGWALYAERLGVELGVYSDRYADFGRLSYEMWRACRLVVDTGLHALGWTRQQAIDFMTAHTGLSPLNIANEVDRYIAWPGQALAYKLGEIKIRALRAQAERELGARFDLRAFHDVVLTSGAVPLDVLEGMVAEWIMEHQ